MARILDNIEQELLGALRATLAVSKRADFCVGYLNLRGWQAVDDLVQPWSAKAGQICRVLVGMQRPPHDEIRDLYRAGSGPEGLPNVTVVSRTMDDKPNLLSNAAKVAALLLADGCERVLIIRDLRPAGPDKDNKPCRAAERQTLLNSLNRAGLTNRFVYLVCVEQELESWLLADETKLAGFLSTATHAHAVKRERKPDRVGNPKSVVMNHFQEARGWRYEDRMHAIKVMRHDVPNWARLRQSNSFARFEEKLTC